MHTANMKRLWVGILAVVLAICCSLPSNALETSPSDNAAIKVNGPLLITGFSFSGHSLKYVQVYNSSSNVVSLEGWRVAVEHAGTIQVYVGLYGYIAPGKYVTAANDVVLPSATFLFHDTLPVVDPLLSSVVLLPPSSINFNNEVAQPAITSSTPRVASIPATFYFSRNISSSTGNYLASFTAFIPTPSFSVVSDPLYIPLQTTNLRVVEIYADSQSCSPFDGTGICSDYVKVYNPSSNDLNLSKIRLRTGSYGQSATSSNTTLLSGSLAPGHYASFPITLSSSGSWVWLEDSYGLVAYPESLVQYPSNTGHDNEAWSYSGQVQTWSWTPHPSPGDTMNRFLTPAAINLCNDIRISEIAANVATEDQFIEIYNPTASSLSLAGCVLQTNRSTTKGYVFPDENLGAGDFRTIYVKDTDLTLTKTTAGTVYVLSSDLKNEIDTVKYEELAEGTSFTYVNGTWLQTYKITPDQVNEWLEFPPCDAGYFRNSTTGLCNKLQSVASTFTECGEGKYRSAETNRCRSYDTVGSSLTPCIDNQVRNPQTNRCRLTMTSQLTPCSAGQERNPATNRCRTKSSTKSVADFPSDSVGAESKQSTLGWWAFAGVVIVAVAYACWEWRSEVLIFFRRAFRFITTRI